MASWPDRSNADVVVRIEALGRRAAAFHLDTTAVDSFAAFAADVRHALVAT